MSKVLEVKNINKVFYEHKIKKFRYQKTETVAVKDISFSLNKGEILGLLGPNGAGKTTTIQMLIGALTPSQGVISYFGTPFDGENPDILKRINFCSAYIELPHRLSVYENLDVYARIYEVHDRKKRIESLLRRFEMIDFIDKKANSLSAGQKTRVVLAKAFINHPEIILLDEPTASLDPEIAKQVRDFILEQQSKFGVSMLFTSHNMKEVQEICDRIIFINKGKIVAEDTPQGLINKFRETKLRFRVEQGKTELINYLTEKKFQFSEEKGKCIFEIREEAIPKVLYKLSHLGVRYQELDIIRPDLEDFFLETAKKK